MVQEVKRMNYHNGLFLDEKDFITDQNYNIQMRRLMNWYLNRVYGVLEGLDVVPSEGKKYKITPGIAISNSGQDKWYGTEIILSSDQEVDFSVKSPGEYYITITYKEDKVDKDLDKGPQEIHWIEDPQINLESVTGYSDTPDKIILAKITVPQGDGNWSSQNVNPTFIERREMGPALRSINNNVAIGTSTQPAKLKVTGYIKAESFEGDGSQLTGIISSQWNDTTKKDGILYEKNVGVGISEPSNTELVGTLTIGDPIFRIDKGDDIRNPKNVGYIRFGDSTGRKLHIGRSQEGPAIPYNKGTDGVLITIQDDGTVGIGQEPDPAFKLIVNGKVKAANVSDSDARFKTDIMPLTNVLDKLEKIRGVSFKWNEFCPYGSNKCGREIGLIAQEVEEVFPELITRWGDEDYRCIDYNRFTGVLLEAIKELKAENEDFKERIKALEGVVSRNGNT